MQPLAGITVLDFSTLLPGPLATLILAEAGARVIKVERPGGEEMRGYAPRFGRESALFALLNRGKESLVGDLKRKADRARVLELARGADVLVEQFRPGVMARLGLGYEALSALNPRLVYCSLTGYGQSGRKRDRAGHDINYIGDAGLLSLSFGSKEKPVVPPALVADIGGGSYPAVMNILFALRAREANGAGCHLDIAMTENAFAFMPLALAEGFASGRWLGSGEGKLTGEALATSSMRPRMARCSRSARSSKNSGSAFARRSASRPNGGPTLAIREARWRACERLSRRSPRFIGAWFSRRRIAAARFSRICARRSRGSPFRRAWNFRAQARERGRRDHPGPSRSRRAAVSRTEGVDPSGSRARGREC